METKRVTTPISISGVATPRIYAYDNNITSVHTDARSAERVASGGPMHTLWAKTRFSSIAHGWYWNFIQRLLLIPVYALKLWFIWGA